MDLALFEELGFTQREIKVYLALIEIGSSTTGPIAAKSGLPLTKVYETLDKLREKGLVSYIVVSKTKHYQASDPQELLVMLDDRKRRLKETVDELKLKQQYAHDKQVATVHEGLKAFKALFDRIADEVGRGDFYYAFAFKADYLGDSAPLFFRRFHKKLEERRIKDSILANSDVKAKVLDVYKDNSNIKIRFIKRSTPLGLIITKDRVIQTVWGERPTAVEIISSKINEQYRIFFEELWKEAKT
ncbi:MAG TPA: helix-turn-helix domain-containing protein [Candidatus Nanoarchaeia archaeon]|nr:helix-turn-helix domain-containing protein [Candidatus Nanoarchaeia archaeon]